MVCSNDSDLEGALVAVKRHQPHLRIGMVAPIQSKNHRHISGDLKKYSDWVKILSVSHVTAAQLPSKIPGSKIQKPNSW